MKKLSILFLCLSVLFSCKKEVKKEEPNVELESTERTAKQSDGLTLLKGEFVYFADAAVLQTHNNIYGVVLNEKVDELNEKAQPFKTDATDFVNVEIRGKIIPKPENEEGWDYNVEIKEILNVTPVNPENNSIIKLEQ